MIDLLSNNVKIIILRKFIFVFSVFIVSYVLEYITEFFIRKFEVKISEEISNDIRVTIINKLNYIKPYFFEKKGLGEVLNLCNRVLSMLEGADITTVIGLMKSMLLVLIILPILFLIDYKVFLTILAMLVVYIFVNKKLGILISKQSDIVIDKNKQLLNSIEENYSNWLNVRMYNRFEYAVNRFLKVNNSFKEASIKMKNFYIINSTVILMLMTISLGIIWFIEGLCILKGVSTIGNVILIMNYQNMLFTPVNYITEFYNKYKTAETAANSLYEFLDTKNEGDNDEIKFKSSIHTIEFKKTNFAYDEQNILINAEMILKKGQISAIVGPSGIGKSTIAKIIFRLKDITEGTVLFNGIDIKNADINDLRKRIGYVSNESVFFYDSIKKNISNEDISNNLLDTYSKKLDLYDKIELLENGWDTVVEQQHLNFSEGESRRIDFIRMLVKQPDVIILDEAIACLDEHRKELFWKCLKEYCSEAIIIVITHNIDDLEHVDFIYHIKNGKFVKEYRKDSNDE